MHILQQSGASTLISFCVGIFSSHLTKAESQHTTPLLQQGVYQMQHDIISGHPLY